MGKILFIDLTKGKIEEEEVPDKIYDQYLSGSGLGAHILYTRIPEGADPLGPDNILGFVSGILTGTGCHFSGRWMVIGKSPLTGAWGEANCGGNFSPAIKRCGYDGIFFTGISPKPVFLYIHKEKIELRDASQIWGMDSVEAEKLLIAEAEGNPRVACIGPAGEKLSFISGVCNDRGRIAARGGLGAVMGSKRLKALVLDGSKKITSSNKETIKSLNDICNKYVKKKVPFVNGPMSRYIGTLTRILPTAMAMDGMLLKAMLMKWGTVSMNRMSPEMGDSPIKNWKGSNKDFGPKESKSVDPDIFKKREIKKYHCYACPMGCGGTCVTKDKFKETHKPEYETVIALGGLCMNEDVDSIFYLNEILNRAGMDTISAGATVAFAIECYENGILKNEDTDGLDLTWGNSKSIVELLDKMIKREGIGDILADGVRVAAQKIGKDSERYAIHAGGQELPMHDGRNDPGFALHYSVEPSPGRHTFGSGMYYELYRLWTTVKGLPKTKILYHKNTRYIADEKMAIKGAACSKYTTVVNGAGLCLFGVMIGSDRVPTFDWLNAATGWNKTSEEYMDIGKKIQSLKQSFNIKHGIDPMLNKPNDRSIGDPPLKEGANKNRTLNLETMMRNYWKHLGWDPNTGKPDSKIFTDLEIK